VPGWGDQRHGCAQRSESVPSSLSRCGRPSPGLERDLRVSGFDTLAHISANELPPADESWRQSAVAVDDALERRYHSRPAWQSAREQEERITLLL
jgi:hypothetical protein